MRTKVLYDDDVQLKDLTVGELKDIIIESVLQADKLKAKAVKELLSSN